jgi:hypothetical protein
MTTCSITNYQVEVTISVSSTVTNLNNVAITISGFVNPYSTTPIPGNVAVLYKSDGVTIKESSASTTMTNF